MESENSHMSLEELRNLFILLQEQSNSYAITLENTKHMNLTGLNLNLLNQGGIRIVNSSHANLNDISIDSQNQPVQIPSKETILMSILERYREQPEDTLESSKQHLIDTTDRLLKHENLPKIRGSLLDFKKQIELNEFNASKNRFQTYIQHHILDLSSVTIALLQLIFQIIDLHNRSSF